MVTFTGQPGPDYFRFAVALGLTQQAPGSLAWDTGRAIAPTVAADIPVSTAIAGQADIEPQMTPAQLGSPIGAFVYGFTGRAAGDD